MERTWDLLSWLVETYGYVSYLEIGCRGDTTFNKIKCALKVGVDPASGGTVRMTSDEYFRTSEQRFDLIFVDGLHERAQVIRDVENSLERLNPNGTIVMHDCDPPAEVCTHVPRTSDKHGWCGDVWKAYVDLRARPDLDMACSAFDVGMGVIRVRSNGDPIQLPKPAADLTWQDLQDNKRSWLRVMPTSELLAWL